LPFPLEEQGCRVFARARHGLWQGVQALGLEPGDAVLVPAYHHGSEVEALLRAGLAPRFYAGTARLEPDEEELASMLGPDVRALYLIHFLGFPQDAARWRAWCDERGLLLIEDAAQAWLAHISGHPVGSFGDLAIFCLYKTIGVPDGGAVLVRAPAAGRSAAHAPGPDSAAPLGALAVVRRHAAWALQHSAVFSALYQNSRSAAEYQPARDFGLEDAGMPASVATQRLLYRIASGRAAAGRRANYALLMNDLAHLVPPPFDVLPAGASPYAFPIEADDKGATLERLAARGLGAVDFWSVPHPSLPVADFPAIAGRRRRTIVLPVHQELRPEHVERIAAGARGTSVPQDALKLEPVESFELLRPEWTALAERSRNVFSTWEWAATWWRHFGAERQLRLMRVSSADGRLLAILPLYVFSARPCVIRFVGHGPADQLGAVSAPGDRVAVARALRQAVARLRPDVLLAERLAADDGWSSLLGGQLLSEEGSPVIDLGVGSWDALMARWSGNLRTQIRRSERRLEREHRFRFRLASEPEQLDQELDRLFELHTACWPMTHSEFAHANRAFHRDFVRVALESGWLRLWLLDVDEETVAAQLVYRFAGADCYYQSGRSPAWQRHSVGTLLMAHTIRMALADGMDEYRLLRGNEPYKYRFATRDPGVETIAVANRRLASAALAARWALPAPVAAFVRWQVRR
jgi:dTDP-4-amino-4,6-dideoxygalactose transaminase